MAEEKSGIGLPPNTAAALSYVFWWLSGIIFLVVEKNDKFVRFHAMQSVITFGGITIASFVPIIGWMLAPLLWVGGFMLWLVLILKAYQGEKFKLPIVGDFAEKQLETLFK